ncbi:ATP-NAD kinase-like domain-containing protein [Panaeolus papilionaceus]|nr:ATP-NAD kinase-like domain-containing protein [Panaeolus papilionaceus]
MTVLPDITIQTKSAGRLALTIDKTALTITKTKGHVHVILRNLICARLDKETKTVSLSYVIKGSKKNLHLHSEEGTVDDEHLNKAEEWVEKVMKLCYDDAGVKRSRNLLVLINPFGGVKKGVSIFHKKVEPIFKLAGCTLQIKHTTHKNHGLEIVKSSTLDYDAVVTVSGDGMVHEVLNGFAQHPESKKAFTIPVAPIPTGSGNGLSLNLLGLDEGFDVVAASINVIKGKPMKVDLFSFTQGDNRVLSFMSQSLGLMADLDIGTEHLRWMGDSRFMYGMLRGIVTYKPCPVQVSFKIAEDDKDKMASVVHARRLEASSLQASEEPAGIPATQILEAVPEGEAGSDGLPPLKYHQDEDGWTTFDDPIMFVYAGKGPYVGRDFMAFPVSLPDDGLVDLMIMAKNSRTDILGAMDGAVQGKSFWHPKVHYKKVHAYRVKPLKEKGILAIDGEPFPFKEFSIEVHKGLGSFLSMYGCYAAPFEPRKVKGGEGRAKAKVGGDVTPKSGDEMPKASNGVAGGEAPKVGSLGEGEAATASPVDADAGPLSAQEPVKAQ